MRAVWDQVYGFDFSCIKKLALREPLVDTVDKDSIVSDACAIKVIDIFTVKKEELNFVADFKLNIKRSDYVHAFVAYFDIGFTCIHKPVRFSTGIG